MLKLNLTPIKNYKPTLYYNYIDFYPTIEENMAAIQAMFIGITSELENTDWDYNTDKASELINDFRDYLNRIYHKEILNYATEQVRIYLIWYMKLWEDWSLCPKNFADKIVSLYLDIINGLFKAGDGNV